MACSGCGRCRVTGERRLQECIKITQPDTCTKGGQSNLTIVTSQLTSGVATYGFTTPDSSEQPPDPTELINIQGTTNDSGALNFIGRNISTVTFTSFNITSTRKSLLAI